MRRARLVIGWTTLAATAVLAAVVFGVSSRHSQSIDNPAPDDAQVTHEDSSRISSIDEAATTVMPPQSFRSGQNPVVTEQVSDTDSIPLSACADEDTHRKRMRDDAMRELSELYSLLLKRLDLTPSETDALIFLLVDIRVAATRTACVRSINIDQQDRSDRIAAIIGYRKLEQLLALEQNRRSFTEVVYMDCVLGKQELSMTEAERESVLQVLIDLQHRELTLPGADAERGTIEWLEYQLAKTDERSRLVFEQAASVLSTEQVGALFEQYQLESYRRADALERQMKARADDNAEDMPLYYPGRSC